MASSVDVRVLLADDIGVMRSALRALLSSFGFTAIDEVSNGEDALKKFALVRYDLVMLDIDMPKKSGMEVLQEIRKANSNVYVIMVSAHSSVGNVKEAVSQGVNAFVVKPYSAKKIEAALAKFARERDFSMDKDAFNV